MKKGNKCYILLSTKEKVVRNIGSAQIKMMHFGKPMGDIFDEKLSFKEHIKSLCGKVRSKPSLSRVVLCLE